MELRNLCESESRSLVGVKFGFLKRLRALVFEFLNHLALNFLEQLLVSQRLWLLGGKKNLRVGLGLVDREVKRSAARVGVEILVGHGIIRIDKVIVLVLFCFVVSLVICLVVALLHLVFIDSTKLYGPNNKSLVVYDKWMELQRMLMQKKVLAKRPQVVIGNNYKCWLVQSIDVVKECSILSGGCTFIVKKLTNDSHLNPLKSMEHPIIFHN